MAVAPVQDCPSKDRTKNRRTRIPGAAGPVDGAYIADNDRRPHHPARLLKAGQGTWLAYLFGTVMLLFVVLCLNQFAHRSAAAGSMYTYTSRGLGPATGVISGWTLIWCYLFIGTPG